METPAPAAATPAAPGNDLVATAATVKEERMWAMVAHLSGFLGHFTGIGHILGPLIIWIWKKDQFPLVNDQGKEALNFQISMTIWFIISGLLCLVVIGIPIIICLGIFYWIVMIIAAIKANDGVAYRYPLTIRFVS